MHYLFDSDFLHWENFETNLSTWTMISSMQGRIEAWGCSIHVTNWWSASGYGGLGPAGHFTCAFTIANCRLPPDSPSAYSNGDSPYLQYESLMRFTTSKIQLWGLNSISFPLKLARDVGFDDIGSSSNWCWWRMN